MFLKQGNYDLCKPNFFFKKTKVYFSTELIQYQRSVDYRRPLPSTPIRLEASQYCGGQYKRLFKNYINSKRMSRNNHYLMRMVFSQIGIKENRDIQCLLHLCLQHDNGSRASWSPKLEYCAIMKNSQPFPNTHEICCSNCLHMFMGPNGIHPRVLKRAGRYH